MGEVVQLGQLKNQQHASSSPHQYLAAVAQSVPLLREAKEAIGKNVAILMAIAISTENPDLRRKTLHQLNDIENKLVQLSLKLLKVKATFDDHSRHMLEAAVGAI